MTSKIKQQNLITEHRIITDSITVGANSAPNAVANVSKSGYKPVALVGISKGGGGSGLIAIGGYYFSADENLYIQLYNPSATARTISVTADILYQPL
jgi:hypothetical protein